MRRRTQFDPQAGIELRGWDPPTSWLMAEVEMDEEPSPFPVAALVLAALRPRMLRLARTRRRRASVVGAAGARGREREILGLDATIAVELARVLDRDPSTARESARRHTVVYVNLPNYTNNLREFSSVTATSPTGVATSSSTRSAWGDNAAIVQPVAAMRAADANHVCIQVIRPDDEVPRADWRYPRPCSPRCERSMTYLGAMDRANTVAAPAETLRAYAVSQVPFGPPAKAGLPLSNVVFSTGIPALSEVAPLASTRLA